jgi:hypothetical protein
MDTSGYYPALSDDDPLFEIADYTQLMKTKLTEVNSIVLAVPPNVVYPAVSTSGTTAPFQVTSFGYNEGTALSVAGGVVTVQQAGIYFISSTNTFQDIGGYYIHSILINGVEKVRGFSNKPNGGVFQYSAQTSVVKLAMGDTISTSLTASVAGGAIRDISTAGNVMTITLLAAFKNV